LIFVIDARQSARPDEELVDRALAGDLDAFSALVSRHYGVVRRVAERIVGATYADDVAQDAFLRAFHRLGQFRRESTFRSWLLRIAHNAALNALERERSRQGEDLEQTLELEAHLSSDRTPADQLELDERRDRLAGKLRLLSPAHRAVLVLRDLEGLSYEEIAVVTETPLGSVKGRLHRARRELIDVLRANTYDWDLPPA
jgi:RNA polymerase sigma-70 factor, ECF subfamily